MVLFASLSMKKTVESQQNNSRRGKKEQAISLHYAFYRSYFVFYLHVTLIKLTFKLAILLKFIHFPLCIQNKTVIRLPVVLGLPHLLTFVTFCIFLTNLFTYKLLLWFHCHFAVCSNVAGKFYFSILERFEITRLPKWWLSQYVYTL